MCRGKEHRGGKKSGREAFTEERKDGEDKKRVKIERKRERRIAIDRKAIGKGNRIGRN